MGRYLYAGSGSIVSLVSNMTGNTLLNGSTIVKPTIGYEGNISYRHRWTPELRSNIGVGIWHLDIPGLNGTVCPAASRATASGGCGLNEQLVMGQVNLIWAPVAFADFGIEYTYGQRKVVSGQRGNEQRHHQPHAPALLNPKPTTLPPATAGGPPANIKQRRELMIELIHGLPRNVVGITTRGRVTREDWDDVLLPAMDEALRRHEKVRLYYEIASRYPGAGWDVLDLATDSWSVSRSSAMLHG